LSEISYTVSITIIISIISIIAAFGASLWKAITENRREKPLLEQGQKAMEERQRKLGLNGKVMPLYVDLEQLTSFYSQSKREKSPLQLESITRSKNSESTAKIDTKIASVEGKIGENEQTVFSEYKNVENMLVTVLESLYETGQLITDLEKPSETDELLNLESYTVLPGKKAEPVPQDIKEAIVKVKSWHKRIMLERMEQLTDKIVIVKGIFTVSACTEQQLDVVFESKGLGFIARGLCENRTKVGASTFKPEAQMNISVFGYVSGIEKREHSVIITPITICRLLS
jgi:hypothetical protein